MNTPITIRGWHYPSIIQAWRSESPPSVSIARVYRRYNQLGWDLERALLLGVRAKRMEQLELQL